MKKLLPALVALAFAAAIVPSYAADEPGRSGDPASAEKKAAPKKKTKTHGAHQTDGRSGDPASAEKKKNGGGGAVKGAGATSEPGRSGDPASAEKKK